MRATSRLSFSSISTAYNQLVVFYLSFGLQEFGSGDKHKQVDPVLPLTVCGEKRSDGPVEKYKDNHQWRSFKELTKFFLAAPIEHIFEQISGHTSI